MVASRVRTNSARTLQLERASHHTATFNGVAVGIDARSRVVLQTTEILLFVVVLSSLYQDDAIVKPTQLFALDNCLVLGFAHKHTQRKIACW